MKKFRPYQVLLFVLLVLSLLLIPAYLIPDGGSKFLGVNWQFLRIENIFSPKKQVSKDISKIIQKVDTTDINSTLVKHKNAASGKLLGAANGGALSTESATVLQ